MSGFAALVLFLAAPPTAEARVIGRGPILEAMRKCQGYTLTATTNGARMQAEVLLRLVREARASDPERRPLFLGHEEWFSAYLERTGLGAERAPTFMRLAHDHKQDTEVDYRTERVLASPSASGPDLAANVVIGWPPQAGGPEAYSYEDLLSNPQLKVTNERVITYRLLDVAGMIVYSKVTGLRGRPTSGFLGFLFRMIGEGHVAENRMLISADGLQISRARVRRLFEVTRTVTVHPDGRTEADVPLGRPDLAALETRINQPLKLIFRPLDSRGP